MLFLRSLALLFAVGLSGCAIREPYSDLPVCLPNCRVVPENVIAKLPRKIARLPVTKNMRGGDFLGALDLEDYSGNIAGPVRFNSHFMQLDRDHILQIRCDPDSLKITKADIDHILNPNTTGFPVANIVVVGCTLRKNGGEVISHRRLDEPKTEQGGGGNGGQRR